MASLHAPVSVQVDGLVDYFNGLFEEDQARIQQLEGEVALRERLLAMEKATQQQHHHQQQALEPPPVVAAAAVVTTASAHAKKLQPAKGASSHLLQQQPAAATLAPAAEQQPWRWHDRWSSLVAYSRTHQRACLGWVLLVAAMLALVIGLAGGLSVARRRALTPQFLFTPELLAPSSGVVNLNVALSHAGTVHYVVLTSAAASGAGSKDVLVASAGQLSKSLVEVGARKLALRSCQLRVSCQLLCLVTAVLRTAGRVQASQLASPSVISSKPLTLCHLIQTTHPLSSHLNHSLNFMYTAGVGGLRPSASVCGWCQRHDIGAGTEHYGGVQAAWSTQCHHNGFTTRQLCTLSVPGPWNGLHCAAGPCSCGGRFTRQHGDCAGEEGR